MRVAEVAWVLCRDHFRRGVAFVEAVACGAVLALFLNPRQGSFEWDYAVLVCGLSACLIPALSAGLVASRAAGVGAEALVLAAGRARYFLGAVAASLVVGLLWMLLLGASAILAGATPGSAPALRAELGAVALNALLAVVVFCLFSPRRTRWWWAWWWSSWDSVPPGCPSWPPG